MGLVRRGESEIAASAHSICRCRTLAPMSGCR